jgi:hypothetical protein
MPMPMAEGFGELRSASSGGISLWMLRVLGFGGARVRVTAPSVVRLGETLEVAWRVERAPEATIVTVSLVGAEVASQRSSSRTGISVITERNNFAVRPIDRRVCERGTEARGRGATEIPAGLVPSLAGKLNQIVWAVTVDVSSSTETIVREEFPITVRP